MAVFFALTFAIGFGQERRPPALIELPYRSEIHWGDGYNLNEDDYAAHPFDLTVPPETEREVTAPSSSILREVARSTKEISETMRATGVVDTTGWRPTMKLDAYYDNSFEFSSTDAMFLLMADKQYGFEGWRSPPPFTQTAKDILCKSEGTIGGVKQKIDYEQFTKIYGTHYVVGQRMAANLNFYMKLSTTTTNSTAKVSAELNAAFNVLGVFGLNTTLNFTRELTRNQAGSHLKIWASAQGASRTFLPDASPETVGDLLKTFNEESSEGTGMAHILRRYEDHPDFIAALITCEDDRATELEDDTWKNMIIDGAIHAKLMADEMVERDPTDCSWRLGEQAYEQYDLILGYSNYTRSIALGALKNITDIENMWNPEANTCKIDERYCKYVNWVSEGEINSRQMELGMAQELCQVLPDCKAVTCDDDQHCTMRSSATLTPSYFGDTTYVLALQCYDSRDEWEVGSCVHYTTPPESSCDVALGFQDTKEDCLGKCQSYDRWNGCQYDSSVKDRSQSNCIRHECMITEARGDAAGGKLCVVRPQGLLATTQPPLPTNYVNNWDRPFQYPAPEATQVIHGMYSKHDNWYDDRRFKFYVNDLPGVQIDHRSWVSINGYERNIVFKCGHNQAITGMGSEHNDHYEDRLWRIRCGDIGHNSKYYIHAANGQACRLSGFVNDWDRDMDSRCHADEVLSGVHAAWSWWNNDRKWRVECCKVVRVADVEVAETQITVPVNAIPAPAPGKCYMRIELAFREVQLCPFALMYGIGEWFEVAKETDDQTCLERAGSFKTEFYTECLKDDDFVEAIVELDRLRNDAYEMIRASLVFTGSPTKSPTSVPTVSPSSSPTSSEGNQDGPGGNGFFGIFGGGGGFKPPTEQPTPKPPTEQPTFFLPPAKEQPWRPISCKVAKNEDNGLNNKCRYGGRCEERDGKSGCACCDPTSVGNWCYGNPAFDGCVPDPLDTRPVCPRLDCAYRKTEQVECKSSRLMKFKKSKNKSVPRQYNSYEKAKKKCDKLGPECIGVYDKKCDGTGTFFLCGSGEDLFWDGESCVWEK